MEEKEADDTELMETEETVEETEMIAMKRDMANTPNSLQPSARAMLK